MRVLRFVKSEERGKTIPVLHFDTAKEAMADSESPSIGCLGCSPCGNGQKEKLPSSLSSSVATISSVTTLADLIPSEKSIEASGGGAARKSKEIYNHERWHVLAAQVTLPFFIAGMGTIGAGVVFGKVQSWPVFKEITILFIVVPALLGLKGNLDMCLASRLSTQANLGNLDSWHSIRKQVVSNMALVQVQAAAASLLVASVAVSGGAIRGSIQYQHALIVGAATITTACVSCFFLDFVLICVIIVSYRFNINPDNVVCPVAASVGDIVSLSLFSTLSSTFYKIHDKYWWVMIIFIAVFVCLTPMWLYLAMQHKQTKKVLRTGWIPVIIALFISSAAGMVMDRVIGRFSGFVLFQPIINGIGGNLASVQSSRIATSLHQTTLLGVLHENAKMCVTPLSALFHGEPQARSARILIAMAVPGQTVFVFVADYLHHGHTTLTLEFVSAYLSASITQIMILLYVGHIMVHVMWRVKIDPDNSAIPYLTAFGDFLGTSLLAVAFMVLEWNGTPYIDGD